MTPSSIANKQKTKFMKAENDYEIHRKNKILVQKMFRVANTESNIMVFDNNCV